VRKSPSTVVEGLLEAEDFLEGRGVVGGLDDVSLGSPAARVHFGGPAAGINFGGPAARIDLGGPAARVNLRSPAAGISGGPPSRIGRRPAVLQK